MQGDYLSIYTIEQSFYNNSFFYGWAWKKYTNKAEIKELKKTTRHLQKIHSTCKIVLLQSFISALFCTFQSRPQRGVTKPTFKWKTRTFIVLEVNTFGEGENTLCIWDEHFSTEEEHFSTEEEHIKNARSNFTQTHTHSYYSNFQRECGNHCCLYLCKRPVYLF